MGRLERRYRRAVGRPGRIGFHRDAAPGGRGGANRRTLLAGASQWHRQFERGTDALAGGKPAIAAASSRSESAGHAGLGCRLVPGSGVCARAMERRP